jgi:putative hydrolase of the HAD superfamily
VQAVDSREDAIKRWMEFDGDGYVERTRLFELACARWPGMGMSPAQLSDWYAENYPLGFTADARTNDFLERIVESGIDIGIVTNGAASQMVKIERTGLDRFASAVVVSETFGQEKPAPAIFEHALNLLRVDPGEDVLFVGDNPTADIDGARCVGMATAWVRRGRKWPSELPPPDYVVDHVSDLASIIDVP